MYLAHTRARPSCLSVDFYNYSANPFTIIKKIQNTRSDIFLNNQRWFENRCCEEREREGERERERERESEGEDISFVGTAVIRAPGRS